MEEIPYSNAIGTVMFSMISTRPDLAYSISLLSRYMSNPEKEHWNALKHLLKYINSSLHAGYVTKTRRMHLTLLGMWTLTLQGIKIQGNQLQPISLHLEVTV